VQNLTCLLFRSPFCHIKRNIIFYCSLSVTPYSLICPTLHSFSIFSSYQVHSACVCVTLWSGLSKEDRRGDQTPSLFWWQMASGTTQTHIDIWYSASNVMPFVQFKCPNTFLGHFVSWFCELEQYWGISPLTVACFQIMIFPEGTCTNRSCLIAFKPGMCSTLCPALISAN